MGRNRTMFLLIIAGSCGLVAMLVANRLLRNQEPDEIPMEGILHAARILDVEQFLDHPDLVEVVEVPVDQVPQGAYQSFDQVQDRWIQMRIFPGEPIIEAKLAPEGAPTGLTVQIPEGFQAYSIRVDEQSSVSGFILPGHRVDVMKVSREGKESLSTRVVQNTLVLASGQSDTRDGSKSILSNTVTLAVTPEQVGVLSLAQDEGNLMLALRRHGDETVYDQHEAEAEEANTQLEREELQDLRDQVRQLLQQVEGLQQQRAQDQDKFAEMNQVIDSLAQENQGLLGQLDQNQRKLDQERRQVLVYVPGEPGNYQETRLEPKTPEGGGTSRSTGSQTVGPSRPTPDPATVEPGRTSEDRYPSPPSWQATPSQSADPNLDPPIPTKPPRIARGRQS